MPSLERLSVAMTKSAPAFRWNESQASTMSASSRASSVMTSFIGRASLREARAGPRSSAASRSSRASTRALGADDAVDLDEHGRLGRERGVLAHVGPRERRALRGSPGVGKRKPPPSSRIARSASRRRVSSASVPFARPRSSCVVGDRERLVELVDAARRAGPRRAATLVERGLDARLRSQPPSALRRRAARESGTRSAAPRWGARLETARARAPNALWFPASIVDGRIRPVRDLLVRVEDRPLVPWEGRRRRGVRSCARRRTRRRPGAGGSGASSRGRRRTAPERSRARPSASPPRGHQNSSASELMTQSAPKSVAASRAMRVTHSSWRMSSPSSRIRWSTPARS